MSKIRVAKTAAKIFISDPKIIRSIVTKTMDKISAIVGSTLGPSGKNCLIESELPQIPHKNTKDGVTVFNSLGAHDPFEHLIIEQTRAAAQRTATEAGDGTTSATILASSLISNLYKFCDKNPHVSPQKVAREMSHLVREELIPFIHSKAIMADDESSKDLLYKVAKVSANGDEDMAAAVINAFELVGFGDSSHVTIRELSGPYGYKVEKIDGFPIPIGYEESMGKFHPAFVNDQANQRCVVDAPLFILYDGHMTDFSVASNVLNEIGMEYANGKEECKNVVLIAHGYGENLLTQLAMNFQTPNTINIIPITTFLSPFSNGQLEFLKDISAFTGAKIFGLHRKIAEAKISDLGKGMKNIEIYRFRTTIVGDSDPANVEIRVCDLKTQKDNAASQAERNWLEERMAKITSGIAKITVVGSNKGEIGEKKDRVEDSVCAVRSAISKGALPGGCRMWVDMALKLEEDKDSGEVAKNVLVPSFLSLLSRLLENAGYNEDDIAGMIETYVDNPEIIYDVENQAYGTAEELGIFDCLPAVEQALLNATGIATVLGTCGGLVATGRDPEFERSEASADYEYERVVSNPAGYTNEANTRM